MDQAEVRVYSRIHGNLTPFHPAIIKVLELFDTPMDIVSAEKKMMQIYPEAPPDILAQLLEKRFLVEANQNEKSIFLEYVAAMQQKNKTPRVSKVTFLVSDQCNLACKGCYHSFFDFKSSKMAIASADRILDGLFPYLIRTQIPKLLISFLGYEPLLNFEAVKAIHDRAGSLGSRYGIATQFHIYTNAFRLDESIHAWIAHNKSDLAVKVSLDGIKEDNDRRRVDFADNGSYDQVVQNLRRIMATGVECSVLTVLSKLNFNNLEVFVEEMAKLGIGRITANLFCGKTEEERRLELSESEKIEAIKRMDLATEKHGIGFDGEWKFNVVQLITGAHFSCPAGTKQLVFSAEGVIYPCQRFAGTSVNFGTYQNDFWVNLDAGQCRGYIRWTTALYDGVMERFKTEKPDLAGWSCPFLPFIRDSKLGRNIEREFNEQLLEWYLTRPINRIMTDDQLH